MNKNSTRVEFTYGEEVDFAGAKEVCKTVKKHDVVIVIDVTGTPIEEGVVIEKCANPLMQKWVKEALEGTPYNMYEGCPDPTCNEDETDVYSKHTPYTFFLGIPVQGGDYNLGPVECRAVDLKHVQQALIRFAETYDKFASENIAGATVEPPAGKYLKPDYEERMRPECDMCSNKLKAGEVYYTCCDNECLGFDLCVTCFDKYHSPENEITRDNNGTTITISNTHVTTFPRSHRQHHLLTKMHVAEKSKE